MCAYICIYVYRGRCIYVHVCIYITSYSDKQDLNFNLRKRELVLWLFGFVVWCLLSVFHSFLLVDETCKFTDRVQSFDAEKIQPISAQSDVRIQWDCFS